MEKNKLFFFFLTNRHIFINLLNFINFAGIEKIITEFTYKIENTLKSTFHTIAFYITFFFFYQIYISLANLYLQLLHNSMPQMNLG